MVEYVSVSSSNIRGVGYDNDTSTLYVDFRSGAQYQYSGVDAGTAAEFKSAGSPGKYFHENIKDAYPTRRV